MVDFTNMLNSPGHVSIEEVSLNLIGELKTDLQPSANHSRILKWQTALQPLFASLEKNAKGNLDQASARYVLHRGFARQHSWYMTGLEPRDAAAGPDSLKEWVPSYLMNLVEELLGTQGINLKELAVLAATLEDLVHKEAMGRLNEIYAAKHLPLDGYITDQTAEEVLQTYMAIYTSAENLTSRSAASLDGADLDLGEAAQVWLREVQRNVTAAHVAQTGVHGTSDLDFQAAVRIAEHVGEKFSTFNDQECKALKSALLSVEDLNYPGQVSLYDFWKKGLEETFWTFDESIEYLRVLGALDESTTTMRVIIPNYVSSETNCLTASSFYKSCCRSECESLMEHLEREINAPTASPARIIKIVAGLPSDAIAGPGVLSPFLMSQLETIADNNGGRVSLHSRPFAQWMHDAFPRECPLPHFSLHPQTPDEWLTQYGSESTKASQAERLEHVERASYEEEQMPWNIDIVDQKQCPIPEANIPEHMQKEDAFAAERQPRRRLSLGFARSTMEATVSEPKTTWHMFEVPDEMPMDAEQPWHMFGVTDQTPASHGHPEDVLETTAAKAATHVELTHSKAPAHAQVTGPDAEALFDQVHDAMYSVEDEVIPMGNAVLPNFENLPEQTTSSKPFSEAVVSGLQKNSFLVFLSILLSAVVGMERMRKRDQGWSKRQEDTGYVYDDIDMGLVRMAAAASISQRYKASASQDIV